MKKLREIFKKSNRGSVVIEATLSLSFFMFFIIILLSIVNMCIAQSKIGVALNESAKEFSEYGYIYSLTGFKEVQKNSYEKEEGTITDIDSAISGLEDAKNAFDSIAGVTESEDPWTDLENAENSAESAKEKYLTIYKNFVDNPGGYILGLARVAGNEGYEWFKGEVGGAVVKGLMYKHLKDASDTDVNAYLIKHRVVGGIDGLDLGSSSIFTNGTDDITFVCKYKLRIIRLLNTDFTFDMCQVAQTKAWAGESLVRDTSSSGSSESDDASSGSASSGSASSTETSSDSSSDASNASSTENSSDSATESSSEATSNSSSTSSSASTTSDSSDAASSASVEDTSDSGDSSTSDSYTDIRNQKIAKYGKDAVEAIEKEYGDETKAWDDSTWSVAAIIYAHENNCPEILDEKELEEYKQNYGESVDKDKYEVEDTNDVDYKILQNSLDNVDTNKQNHIINASQNTDHHWELVVGDNKKSDWSSIKQVLYYVAQNGVYEVHSGTPSKVAEVNGQRVRLKYYVLPNGQVKISDAWVITKEGG